MLRILFTIITILSLISRQILSCPSSGDSNLSFFDSYKNAIKTAVSDCISSLPMNITISFVGDCMIASHKGVVSGNNFAATAKKQPTSYFLEKVAPIFNKDDFTVANLECVLTDNELSEVAKSGTRKFWFKAPTSHVNILTNGGVDIVSLANNHTNDYGQRGYKDTIDAVESTGLIYGTQDKIVYFEKYNIKFALICCGLWSQYSSGGILNQLNKASENSDYQIIYFHGGTEGVHDPEDWKVTACRKFVDNGADLVIGGHPHVLQPIEVYKDVPIVYSLGNFCYGGHNLPENKTIIYQAKIKVQNSQVIETKSNIIPCYVFTGKTNNWQPAPIADEKDKNEVLKIINTKIGKED